MNKTEQRSWHSIVYPDRPKIHAVSANDEKDHRLVVMEENGDMYFIGDVKYYDWTAQNEAGRTNGISDPTPYGLYGVGTTQDVR